MKRRRHIGSDPWGRGSYDIPANAVMGSSDCGMGSDSPCPSDKVKAELERFRQDLLIEQGIKSRFGKPTQSGNLFMGKQWVIVPSGAWERAARYALEWLKLHKWDTHWVHSADQEDVLPKEVTHDGNSL